MVREKVAKRTDDLLEALQSVLAAIPASEFPEATKDILA